MAAPVTDAVLSAPPASRGAVTTGAGFRPGAHIPGLDSLRGITILWTLFYHYNRMRGGDNLAETAYIGWALMGVAAIDVFFVISGFLITGILLDSRGSPTYLRTFYTRRAIRIFPLYYGFLLLWFVVMPNVLPGDVSDFTPPASIEAWYWLYGQNALPWVVGADQMPSHTYHLWSLALEEQFYLTWPLIVGLLSRGALKKLCIALVLLAPVYRTVLYFIGAPYEVGFLMLPGRGDTLAIGCLLALMVREPGGMALAIRWARPGLVVGMGVIIATMAVNFSFFPQIPFVRTIGMSFSALAAFSVTVLTMNLMPGTRLYRFINAKSVIYVGTISYAVYVFHLPLELMANRYGFEYRTLLELFGSSRPLAQAVYSLTLVAGTLVLAALSWRFFEKPILGLRKYLPYGTSTRKVKAAA